MKKSYAQVIHNDEKDGKNARPWMHWKEKEKEKPLFVHLQFNIEEEGFNGIHKAFTRVVVEPGSTYSMQKKFHSKSHFTIKISPLGANLCLMEENEDGELKALVHSGLEWISEWFLRN